VYERDIERGRERERENEITVFVVVYNLFVVRDY